MKDAEIGMLHKGDQYGEGEARYIVSEFIIFIE